MNNIGLLGSLLLTFCGVPELIRTLKNRRCDIGWGFLLMWFFGELLCLFYGMDLKEIPLLINYSSNLLIVSVMMYYKINGELPEWLKEQFAKLWPSNWSIGSNPIFSAKSRINTNKR